ncbi:MAG: alpha/beta hydrolase [Magnetococcales bacterium]|nr:alpha/beta hydrolase [Magnetococcales bacterium]MBF0157030.1 alpha/beta hydrolase [Magnetococcales bacterium]
MITPSPNPSGAAPAIILVHGWGFGPGFWHPLLSHWPVTAIRVNLGFFGRQHLPERPEGPWIGVGHSLGFLWILREMERTGGSLPKERCLGLASINGFSRFSRQADFPAGVPGRVLERMRTALTQDPGATLAAFRRQSGLEPSAPPQAPGIKTHHERLDAGLSWLATWDGRATLRTSAIPLLALAARDDAIVPQAMTEAAFAGLSGDRFKIHWAEVGGHTLPLTQPALCATTLQGFFEAGS